LTPISRPLQATPLAKMWRVRNTHTATTQLRHIAGASGVWFRHNAGAAAPKSAPDACGNFSIFQTRA